MTQNTRIGRFLTTTVAGEPVKAYLPAKLPPVPGLDLALLYPHLERATLALSELNGVISAIPNTSLFIYMYVRKEALLSSQIEGTQSSFSDLMLFENDQKASISIDDVEEVSNYVTAIHYGLNRLSSGFPLCLRLLKEIHRILLQGGRGSQKSPGEFRRSQNWIGGTRPGNALFVPPPPEKLAEILSDFEKFLHDDSINLSILLKAGLLHVQFETIHPFLDGNGRLGRLLITLLLCDSGLLREPVLYLSLYLKENRQIYYSLLQEVRTNGAWETWLEFFLNGIEETAKNSLHAIRKIEKLFKEDAEKINTLGKAKPSCFAALEYLKKMPQTSVKILKNALAVTAPTARAALKHLVDLGIVEETKMQQRGKVYVYKRYLSTLESGTTPFI